MTSKKATFTSPLSPPDTKKTGNQQLWAGLEGCAQSVIISGCSQQQRPMLVVTKDMPSTQQLVNELSFFTQGLDNVPVIQFPDWETLPYDHFSPPDDIVSFRLQTLYQLLHLKQGIIVAPATTLMSKVAPPSYLKNGSLVLRLNDAFDINAMRLTLESAGYRHVDTVYGHGEYATRGALFDIYPMGSPLPYRIELFDDTVETLRTFDPETQRTVGKTESISLLPAREFPLDKQGIQKFRLSWHEHFEHVDHRQCSIYQDISDGIAPAGIEYYLPLFFEESATLFDYLPSNTHIISTADIENSCASYWHEIHNRYESRQGDLRRPILPPQTLFLSTDTLFSRLKDFSQSKIITDAERAHTVFDTERLPTIAINAQTKTPLLDLQNFLGSFEGRVLLCVESAGRREVLLDILKPLKLSIEHHQDWSGFLASDSRIGITENWIEHGCIIDGANIAIVTENELFGQQVKQRRRRQKDASNPDAVIKNLTELHIGAPVVHIDHGVGRYLGLQTLSIDEQDTEFLCLEYADQAKLYVPVTHLHLINRYTGSDEQSAPLHKLGSDYWSKAKEKAAKQVRDVAAELLDIYARRDAQTGQAYGLDKEEYQRFANSFPFEETPDQANAIQAVLRDMTAEKSMDRLVCGDVGFGKTEVAIRAAYIATQAGKQVAMLVPTTLLAQQHFENFRDRFADWPINVEVVSRFKTTKEVRAIEEKIAQGQIDILIGTHKILNEDFAFRSLGLLIIDEEHRFGVRQKEAVKSLRSEIDILTLTATPIPRTLNMAMHGIRDLSIIATPPARRLSIKTFVHQYDSHLIKEAVLREILRGGQVFFLHNDIKTIDKAARDLADLIPEARVTTAHGQMRERELEHIMSEFYHQRFNVLVCSTIIETGIDIPNANTIIIERADKLGLAQLHQLRGRVGRSYHQAYAYLLTPHEKSLSADAEKRLEAITQADDLGAGFTLATHDLEIRGAGELLGDGQSGQMHTIGFSLYMEMLEQAVKAVREGKTLSTEELQPTNIDVNLHIPALIPSDYIPDVHTRLQMYKRLATLRDNEGFKDFQVELIDRFGLLPDEVNYLIRATQIKLKAEALGIQKIDANAKQGRIEFNTTPNIDPLTLVKLVQTQPQNYQLRGASRLLFAAPMHTAEERLDCTEKLLLTLTQKD